MQAKAKSGRRIFLEILISIFAVIVIAAGVLSYQDYQEKNSVPPKPVQYHKVTWYPPSSMVGEVQHWESRGEIQMSDVGFKFVNNETGKEVYISGHVVIE